MNFLLKGIKFNTKFCTLKGLHQSDEPPKQTGIKFELRGSEKAKHACSKEHATFLTAVTKAKQKVSQWFEKLVTQVADWEISAAKFALAENILDAKLNFCHASICTSIAKEYHLEALL